DQLAGLGVEEGAGRFEGVLGVREADAAGQLQLDLYGEVIDAVTLRVGRGGRLDRETQRMLRGFGEYVCRSWTRPDDGIWELRGDRQHHTHSRALCWVALDRLLTLHAGGHLRLRDVDAVARTRDGIRAAIETGAWNADLQSYVATAGGTGVDAALLQLARCGFEAPSSPRMRATWARIQRELGAGRGLLYRSRAPPLAGEGAFGLCAFWAAEYLALGGGALEEATKAFDALLQFRNDIGLYAEEIDPRTGRALGNFPQAFTHIGLINAALTIEARREREEAKTAGPWALRGPGAETGAQPWT
ncbi:MAG: glycoside hydrolase family 15 protein, partial [Myxococcales bacterium]